MAQTQVLAVKYMSNMEDFSQSVILLLLCPTANTSSTHDHHCVHQLVILWLTNDANARSTAALGIVHLLDFIVVGAQSSNDLNFDTNHC